MINAKTTLTVVRWTAHVLGFCVMFCWGLIFLGHLRGAIARFPGGNPFALPQELFNLFWLSGYLIALKWRVIGPVLVIAGAFEFFIIVMGVIVEPKFLYFSLTIIPAIILLICVWWSKRKPSS